MAAHLPVQHYFEHASQLVFGCMGLGGDWTSSNYESTHVKHAEIAVNAALESGITVFDHADIYTRSKAESVFGEVLKHTPSLRDNMVIQSKCGIRFEDEHGPGRYDFSYDWIVNSTEGSLSRLGIECLDILILHRPDPLMEIDEVVKAFDRLIADGKVKHFGVSNMHAHQVNYIQSAIGQPIIAHQLEMSLLHTHWLDESVTAGMPSGANTHFSPGVIEQSQTHGIQLQAWGSLAQGKLSGRNLDGESENVVKTAQKVKAYAQQFGVSEEAIVLSWLCRHPSRIQPVIGTTNPSRIRACSEFEKVKLSREQWYDLYVTARGERLP